MTPVLDVVQPNDRHCMLKRMESSSRESVASKIVVDLWVSDERNWTTSAVDGLLSVLSEDERRRADRYRDGADRARSILARAMARYALSMRDPERAPAEWYFRTTDKGRPVLVDDGPAFSVTHTTGMVGVALAEVDVGLDAEWIDRGTDVDLVGRRWFHADEAAEIDARAGRSRRRAFFEFWTLKEAYAKALGMGLSIPFRSLRFFRDPPIGLERDATRVEGWTFRLVDVSRDDHVLAVAVRADDVELAIRDIVGPADLVDAS